MPEIRELLQQTTPEIARVPSDEIVRRGRGRVRTVRAAGVVAVVAAVAVVAGGVMTLGSTSPIPDVADPKPEPTTAPSSPTASGAPNSVGGLVLVDGPAADHAPPVPYLDPADDADAIVAGDPDVLHGTVDGEPVAVALTGYVDRQQQEPALVVDPSDPAVVYYTAARGLDACLAGSASEDCRVAHDVRRVDLRAGTDEVVVADAMSIAVRADGTMATVLLDPAEQELGPPPIGRIAVRGDGGPWEPRTDQPGRYHLQGWTTAGLLTAVDSGGHREGTDDVALVDEAGNLRPVVDRGEGSLDLADVSPDGRQALLISRVGECCDTSVLLVDLAAGEVLDELDGSGADWRAEAGTWVDQSRALLMVVEGRQPALLPLRIKDDRLIPETSLAVGEAGEQDIYAIAATEPDMAVLVIDRPDDASDRHRALYADCHLTQGTCRVHDIGLSPHAAYLARPSADHP